MASLLLLWGLGEEWSIFLLKESAAATKQTTRAVVNMELQTPRGWWADLKGSLYGRGWEPLVLQQFNFFKSLFLSWSYRSVTDEVFPISASTSCESAIWWDNSALHTLFLYPSSLLGVLYVQRFLFRHLFASPVYSLSTVIVNCNQSSWSRIDVIRVLQAKYTPGFLSKWL